MEAESYNASSGSDRTYLWAPAQSEPAEPGLGLPGYADPSRINNPAYLIGSPVTAQPQSMPQPSQVVVMTTQNTTILGQRPWTTGLCGCFEDIGICLCGTFCIQCYACQLSAGMGEGCCLPCCCGVSAMVALRVKLRTQENITGSISNDNCVMCCCYPCAICQMGREWEAVKRKQAGPMQHVTNMTHIGGQ